MENNSWQKAADSPVTKLGTGGQKQLGTRKKTEDRGQKAASRGQRSDVRSQG
jgi:hypothetical protein